MGLNASGLLLQLQCLCRATFLASKGIPAAHRAQHPVPCNDCIMQMVLREQLNQYVGFLQQHSCLEGKRNAAPWHKCSLQVAA